MDDWRSDRVRAAIDGRNPTVLAELGDAFAVIGDVQFLPGYALALTKAPGVDRLTDLPRSVRIRYLTDVDLVATAVENVQRAVESEQHAVLLRGRRVGGDPRRDCDTHPSCWAVWRTEMNCSRHCGG